ncbi:MAG TPA: IS21 family transposase [Stellaceae bacterium]|nr:IS21 family transposase [Stellaceae bacterium]
MRGMLLGQGSPRGSDPWGEVMLAPEEVTAMVRLHRLGWGTKRIAGELGCSRNTVRRYLATGGWVAIRQPRRKRRLDGLDEWLAKSFRRHRGNCDVVRQDLLREHGITVSLRTVERAVAPSRQAVRAEARACLRFETAPGQQLQIDFGETRVPIGGDPVRVHLFVATLGYSRRVFVRAFRHERQSAWFDGMEGAFQRFGGVPREVLFDNARALVDHHDAGTREVRFNGRLHAFARHWGFRPRACAPYRARTKGKDERGVGYVKRNAIAGHAFDSWAAFEAHLEWWMREIADVRVHGTTGEAPLVRFERDETAALKRLDGRPSFRQVRELVRRVQADCAIEVDGNSYSVPWRLIGESVQVIVADGRVRVQHGGAEVAAHAETTGRRQRILDPAHFHGVAGFARPVSGAEPAALAAPELLRPLAEYERVVDEGWS